jgi:hypothetical protein
MAAQPTFGPVNGTEAGEQAMSASDDLQVAEGDVRLKEPRDKYPSTDAGYVSAREDHTERVLQPHADSCGYLEEALQDAAANEERVRPS